MSSWRTANLWAVQFGWSLVGGGATLFHIDKLILYIYIVLIIHINSNIILMSDSIEFYFILQKRIHRMFEFGYS